MDAVDARIIRQLTWHPMDPSDRQRGIQGPWEVATHLGLHGTTVKRRLRAMEEAGVLNGLGIRPEPSLIGLELAWFELQFPDAATRMTGVETIRSQPLDLRGRGFGDIHGFSGDVVWVAFAVPQGEDLDDYAREVARDAGATITRTIGRERWPHEGQLSDLDRRILTALERDALTPVTEVAEAIGVTAKTVRRRAARMAKGGVFCVMPMFRPDKVDGVVLVFIAADKDEPRDPASSLAFAERVPDAFMRGPVYANVAVAGVALSNVAQADDYLRAVQDVPGTHGARALVLQEYHSCLDGLPESESPGRRTVSAATPLI